MVCDFLSYHDYESRAGDYSPALLDLNNHFRGSIFCHNSSKYSFSVLTTFVFFSKKIKFLLHPKNSPMPLLSILIPTKNRYNTLLPVLDALLNNIQGDDYEIVVQDNSTMDVAIGQQKIKALGSEKVKYFFCEEPLSVSDNTNHAISNGKGDFVTFIGDDDLVSPYILQIVGVMVEKGVDCLISSRGNYYWPDVVIAKEYAYHYPASLFCPIQPSFDIELKQSEIEMKKVLHYGGVNTLMLPSLYHGIVKRFVLETIKERFGVYVPGSSPDIALSTALCCVLATYGYINYPVTITGASRNSAAGMGARKAHVARIEDVPWLPKQLVNTWDSRIPRIWTGTTIYAQSIIEVYSRIGLLKTVDFANMYANMFIREPKTKLLVFPFLIKISMNTFPKIVYIVLTLIKAAIFSMLYSLPGLWINRWYHFKGTYSTFELHKGVGSVDACMQLLMEKSNSYSSLKKD